MSKVSEFKSGLTEDGDENVDLADWQATWQVEIKLKSDIWEKKD